MLGGKYVHSWPHFVLVSAFLCCFPVCKSESSKFLNDGYHKESEHRE